MRAAKSVDDLTQRNVDVIAAMEKAAEEHRTFGERVADGFAACVGSWPFIITQSLILVAWVALNVVGWMRHWDPFPFILLNLALSFQAAYASPIIMMSQNRQSRLSERRNHLDLQINLLAEQENTEILRLLRKLCQKFDVPVQDQPTAQVLEQATEPQTLVQQIEKTVQEKDRSEEPPGPTAKGA